MFEVMDRPDNIGFAELVELSVRFKSNDATPCKYPRTKHGTTPCMTHQDGVIRWAVKVDVLVVVGLGLLIRVEHPWH